MLDEKLGVHFCSSWLREWSLGVLAEIFALIWEQKLFLGSKIIMIYRIMLNHKSGIQHNDALLSEEENPRLVGVKWRSCSLNELIFIPEEF